MIEYLFHFGIRVLSYEICHEFVKTYDRTSLLYQNKTADLNLKSRESYGTAFV